MEAGLTRKESKKQKHRDETDQQLASEEGTKERKHRKKRDGKRKKKRSSVPNLDDEENSKTLGHDNKGLDQDQSVSEPGLSTDKSVDLASQESSEITPQERIGQAISSRSSQGPESEPQERTISTNEQDSQNEGIVGLLAESEQGADLEPRRTEIPAEGGEVAPRQGSAGSDQGLRRRATLTEIGRSFDDEQESSEVRYWASFI
jgi:hypothetical protein